MGQYNRPLQLSALQPLTREQAAARLRRIQGTMASGRRDVEKLHGEADEVLLGVLLGHGLFELAEIWCQIDQHPRGGFWYA